MKLSLTGGAYQSRSVISSAQRCVNLYPEINPEDAGAPYPLTHYPTPGLDLLVAAPIDATVRQTYRASNGDLYVIISNNVYFISSLFVPTYLGSIDPGTKPAYFADNGLVILLVDGSSSGYAIRMSDKAFGQITDPSFYGAVRVDYVDTFFLLNRPFTNQWYISLSNITYDMLTGTSGSILSGSIASGGTAYTAGAYSNVPLTGGTGTGAIANITVAGGAVTVVTFVAFGSGYTIGDVLSANNIDIGNTGSGFGYSVDQLHGYAFDPLDIAAKTGYPDGIAGLIVMHAEVWLIGQLTTEVWSLTGAADFAFARVPGSFIDHGTVSPYSIAAQDLSVYWLSRDKQGHAIVLEGSYYQAKRISTHAIENEFQKYAVINDAIGFTYQQEGHIFYVIVFPSANKGWAVDIETKLWHEWCWTDNNGNLNRPRANCMCFAYAKNIVGDWENGNIYALDLDAPTDNGQPISRIRSWPLLINKAKREVYNQFIADMEVGDDDGSIDGADYLNPPPVYLRWSDDRGKTWGNRIMGSLGAAGEYLTCIQFQRLGMARYRVFELSWSAPIKTALNGAWVTDQSAET